MRNTSFSPLCAAFLLMLLSPLAAGAAQPQKPVSSPLTITVQEAEPGQMLLLSLSSTRPITWEDSAVQAEKDT